MPRGKKSESKPRTVKVTAQHRFTGSDGAKAILALLEGPVASTISFRIATGEDTEKGNPRYARVYTERVEPGQGAKALKLALKAAEEQGWKEVVGRTRELGIRGEIPKA